MPIERAPHTQNVLRCNMGIDHGRLEIFVSEQLLNRPNVVSVLQQVRCETVPLMPISA